MFQNNRKQLFLSEILNHMDHFDENQPFTSKVYNTWFLHFVVILKKSAGNFPTRPNAAIKVKVKFKELIGTLAKVQGIFHVF